eukprot:CAMPEP_0198224508 /NCGR_PEP_ID=MMETSP1445-20131203/97227_1 /TAXON_ID=36898 /ORGANISM="Pyramimonas sp., Strain CCMP2087" /LENGTH=34 /DNA_ID= /DNA_START= /DNA_END= /DNA_ORIENTATION=
MRYRLQLSTDMNGTDANNYTESELEQKLSEMTSA